MYRMMEENMERTKEFRRYMSRRAKERGNMLLLGECALIFAALGHAVPHTKYERRKIRRQRDFGAYAASQTDPEFRAHGMTKSEFEELFEKVKSSKYLFRHREMCRRQDIRSNGCGVYI